MVTNNQENETLPRLQIFTSQITNPKFEYFQDKIQVHILPKEFEQQMNTKS